ncbi:hypothetical protein LJR175_003132 [Variovorax sp. LjRoot175]|uniref:hypothetical protein n=1 Tax=Variovorax sp. LjRoot175 TaxID=3342276 RepID=UPI003ED00700
MKAWSSFLRDVRLSAPATPEPIAEHAVLRAAQEFCRYTRAWVVELDPTITQEGVREYDLELEQGTELVRIESATFNGEDYPVWRPGEAATCDRYLFTPDARAIAFTKAVGAGLPLVVRCSVTPGETATGLDDVLFARYVKDIALGAVAELTSDDAKRTSFMNRMDRIKTDLWRGNAAIRPRARAHLF